jgi:hypothetical protein
MVGDLRRLGGKTFNEVWKVLQYQKVNAVEQEEQGQKAKDLLRKDALDQWEF